MPGLSVIYSNRNGRVKENASWIEVNAAGGLT